MISSSKKARFLTILCLIAVTVVLHYNTPHRLMYLHVLLQALFFIPVSLSGWWFGKKGGLLVAALIFLVYIHHAVTVMMPTAEMIAGNGIQILLFFIVGALAGTYSDIRNRYQQATRGSGAYPPVAFPAQQKLLVYLDDSGASMSAVRYIAHVFNSVSSVKVTLLKVMHAPEEDSRESQEPRAERPLERVVSHSSDVMALARTILLESGFPSTNIESRFVERENSRVSDILLAEQRSSDYSAVVVGRHRLTRTEEFLFGSVAIHLARQAGCPVWVIGDTSTSGMPA